MVSNIFNGILIFLFAILIWNYYNRFRTFREWDKELDKVKFEKLSKKSYLKKCFDLVGKKFVYHPGCFFKHFWKNIFIRNMLSYSQKCVPCHIQNSLLRHALLRRFHNKEIKQKITWDLSRGVPIHFYLIVKLNGKWQHVDVYFSKAGMPFGQSVALRKMTAQRRGKA